MTNEPIRVGFVGTFSTYTPGMSASHQLIDGVRSWFGGFNERGGVGGRPIELVTGDDQGHAETGAREARRLIEQEGVPVIVFVSASHVMQAVLAYSTTKHVAVAGTGGALLPLFRPVNPWVFTSRTPYEWHGQAMAEFMASLGFKKLAVISTGDGTGLSYAPPLRARFEELGGSVAHQELIPRGDLDFDAAAKRVVASNPEAVVCTSFAPTSAALFRGARALGLNVKWGFGPSAANPETVALIGAEQIDGHYGQSSFEALGSGSPAITAFLEDVRRFGSDPIVSSLTQMGYTTARGVSEALAAIDGPITGDAVRAALEGLSGDYGIMLPFKLGPENHLMNAGVQIVQFQGGQAVPVGPIRRMDGG